MDRRRDTLVLFAYAVFCVLLVLGCVHGLRERFGTHRPLIHVVSVLLTAVYAALVWRLKAGNPSQLLGHFPPRSAKWAWWFLLFGILTGAGRVLVYRWTGLGGVELYERQFAGLLTATMPVEGLVRWTVFPLLVYLAVLLPGVFFFGVIQESFRRARLLAVGTFVQALLFGYVHCHMTGTFNFFYGLEAFLGGLAFGVACHLLGNVYVPAVFLAANVATATLMVAL